MNASLLDPPLPLFVYGTLRDPDLLAAVLGRSLRPCTVHAARAPGFRAVAYPRRVYPALVRVPGAAADGLLLTGLSPFERDLLDAWEGDEYRRRPIAAMLADEPELHEADAYLPVAPVSAAAPEWSLSRWQAEHKAVALVTEYAAAARLRERLLAIRPNWGEIDCSVVPSSRGLPPCPPSPSSAPLSPRRPLTRCPPPAAMSASIR